MRGSKHACSACSRAVVARKKTKYRRGVSCFHGRLVRNTSRRLVLMVVASNASHARPMRAARHETIETKGSSSVYAPSGLPDSCRSQVKGEGDRRRRLGFLTSGMVETTTYSVLTVRLACLQSALGVTYQHALHNAHTKQYGVLVNLQKRHQYIPTSTRHTNPAWSSNPHHPYSISRDV